MNKIIRWYNQSRQIIWMTILVIIGVISLIRVLNNSYKNAPKQQDTTRINANDSIYNRENYSIITETQINKPISDTLKSVIEDFFDYCNKGKIEKAYNLISDDCKKALYPDMDSFKEKYYNRIFTEQKMYNSTLWISHRDKNTYRLEIMGDILATGEKEEMPIEEYYTVVKQDDGYRVNISNYIGKEEINVSKEQDGIIVTIVNKTVFMDYEKYEIKVENKSQKNIVFNTKQNTDSMYIKDNNGLKYIAFLNEISEYDLNILKGLTKTYNIKFNRAYKPTIKVEKVLFKDIRIGQEKELKDIEIDI